MRKVNRRRVLFCLLGAFAFVFSNLASINSANAGTNSTPTPTLPPGTKTAQDPLGIGCGNGKDQIRPYNACALPEGTCDPSDEGVTAGYNNPKNMICIKRKDGLFYWEPNGVESPLPSPSSCAIQDMSLLTSQLKPVNLPALQAAVYGTSPRDYAQSFAHSFAPGVVPPSTSTQSLVGRFILRSREPLDTQLMFAVHIYGWKSDGNKILDQVLPISSTNLPVSILPSTPTIATDITFLTKKTQILGDNQYQAVLVMKKSCGTQSQSQTFATQYTLGFTQNLTCMSQLIMEASTAQAVSISLETFDQMYTDTLALAERFPALRWLAPISFWKTLLSPTTFAADGLANFGTISIDTIELLKSEDPSKAALKVILVDRVKEVIKHKSEATLSMIDAGILLNKFRELATSSGHIKKVELENSNLAQTACSTQTN